MVIQLKIFKFFLVVISKLQLISNILNSESLLNSNSGSNLYSTYKLIRIETPFKTKYGTISFLYNIHYFLTTGKIIGNNQWKSNSLSCKTIRCRKMTMQNCIYFTEFVQKKWGAAVVWMKNCRYNVKPKFNQSIDQ